MKWKAAKNLRYEIRCVFLASAFTTSREKRKISVRKSDIKPTFEPG
jgi:hypothetical protein